jgi:N-acetylglutamate synthase-like GNAT family acetyltransferase
VADVTQRKSVEAFIARSLGSRLGLREGKLVKEEARVPLFLQTTAEEEWLQPHRFNEVQGKEILKRAVNERYCPGCLGRARSSDPVW